MMYDLTGYMVINGKDAWTEYSAFLCEDRPEDSTNMAELLKPPEMKEYTAVDFRERNGEELPQQLPLPRCKPRDLTLYLAVRILGSDLSTSTTIPLILTPDGILKTKFVATR